MEIETLIVNYDFKKVHFNEIFFKTNKRKNLFFQLSTFIQYTTNDKIYIPFSKIQAIKTLLGDDFQSIIETKWDLLIPSASELINTKPTTDTQATSITSSHLRGCH